MCCKRITKVNEDNKSNIHTLIEFNIQCGNSLARIKQSMEYQAQLGGKNISEASLIRVM